MIPGDGVSESDEEEDVSINVQFLPCVLHMS